MPDAQTILVVEDSPTMRRQIADILEQNGYHVITAADGEEALQQARQHHPELIVLDIVLPKKNGFQVCRSVKSDPELAIKILMLTAKNQEKDRVWGQRQGADLFLAKPVDPEVLLDAVNDMIGLTPSQN
jgi:twitching motility two-component system response regulator PilH